MSLEATRHRTKNIYQLLHKHRNPSNRYLLNNNSIKFTSQFAFGLISTLAHLSLTLQIIKRTTKLTIRSIVSNDEERERRKN